MMKVENMSYTMAFWLLRIWISVRCIFTGLVKFQGKEEVVVGGEGLTAEEIKALQEVGEAMGGGVGGATETVNAIGWAHYQALPQGGPMSISSFKASPLMPSFMVEPYAWVLGFALIGLGVALFLGICTRVTLFLTGLLFISLTYGFVILEKDLKDASAAGAAYLGVHMVLIAMALVLSKHNRFELLSCNKLPFCKCCSCETK